MGIEHNLKSFYISYKNYYNLIILKIENKKCM